MKSFKDSRRRRRPIEIGDGPMHDTDEELLWNNEATVRNDDENSISFESLNSSPAVDDIDVNSFDKNPYEKNASDQSNSPEKDRLNGGEKSAAKHVQRSLWIANDSSRVRGRRGRFSRERGGMRGRRSNFSHYRSNEYREPREPSADSTDEIIKEHGKVVTIRDQFGFLRCPHRADDVFFHLSEAPTNVKIGDEFEFIARINGRSRRECATELTFIDPGTVQLQKLFPGLWSGKVERDIHVPGGAGSSMFRKKNAKTNNFSKMEMSLDGLIKILERRDRGTEEAEEIDEDFTNQLACFALADVLPTLEKQGTNDLPPLLSKGDEVEFQLAEDTVSNRIKAVSIRLVMTARARKDIKDKMSFETANVPKEIGEIKRIHGEYGFIQCPSRSEQLYFSVASVELSSEYDADASKVEVLCEGMMVEFWPSEQYSREGRSSWRALGVRVIPPELSTIPFLLFSAAEGYVTKTSSMLKDPRRFMGSFNVDYEKEVINDVSFLMKDMIPGLMDTANPHSKKMCAIRLELNDRIVADIYKFGDCNQFCAKNVKVKSFKGPRLEGHVINLREKEGFGFIKPSPLNAITSTGNVFFHIGDVFSGVSELFENVEVRYTLVRSDGVSEKPKATQVEALPRGTIKILSHGGPRMLKNEAEGIRDSSDGNAAVSSDTSVPTFIPARNMYMKGIIVKEATSSPRQLGAIEVCMSDDEFPLIQSKIISLSIGKSGDSISFPHHQDEQQMKCLLKMISNAQLKCEASVDGVIKVWKPVNEVNHDVLTNGYISYLNGDVAQEEHRINTLKYALADVEESLVEGPIEPGDIVEFDKLKCDGRAQGETYRAAHVVLKKKAMNSWGVITEVHYDRHFGFIICALTTEKIFFHLSEVLDVQNKVSNLRKGKSTRGGKHGNMHSIPVFRGQEVSFTLGIRHGKKIGLNIKCLPAGYLPPEFLLEGQYIGAILESPRRAIEGVQGLCDGSVAVLYRADKKGYQADDVIDDSPSIPYLKILPVSAETCSKLPLERGEVVYMDIMYVTFASTGHYKVMTTSVVKAVNVTPANGIPKLPSATGKIAMRDENHIFIHRNYIKVWQEAAIDVKAVPSVDYFMWKSVPENNIGQLVAGDEVEYLIPMKNSANPFSIENSCGMRVIGVNKALQFSSRSVGVQATPKTGQKNGFSGGPSSGNQFRMAKGPDGSVGFPTNRGAMLGSPGTQAHDAGAADRLI